MSTGIVIAVAISSIASIAGGIIQGNAAKKAAEANARVQREALALQETARQEARADVAPQVDIGQRASATLAGTATSFEEGGLDRTFEDERDDFLEENATRAINQALAARGQAFSGAALESIGQSTTDIRTAGTQREVDLLTNLTNIGTNAALGVASTNANLTAQSSNALASIGAGNAQGIADQGTALAGGIQSAGTAAFIGGAIASRPKTIDQEIDSIEFLDKALA